MSEDNTIQQNGSKNIDIPIKMSESKSLEEANDKPMKNLRYGSVSTALWKNRARNGKIFFSVSGLKRVYITGQTATYTGTWKETPNLRIQDIPDAILCLEEAYKSAKIEARRLFERKNELITDSEEA